MTMTWPESWSAAHLVGLRRECSYGGKAGRRHNAGALAPPPFGGHSPHQGPPRGCLLDQRNCAPATSDAGAAGQTRLL